MQKPRLLLIDGHSLAYRAYFAMANNKSEPLSVTHPDGRVELTGAAFAFTNMLLKVWREQKPDYIAVAFDIGRTFRDDIYSAYKATRDKAPEDLDAQIKRIQQIVRTLHIPIFTAEGFEADDVLGTLARRASGEGIEVLIVTGDRDALQLVSPAVKVLTSRQRFEDTIVYDEAAVHELLGVRPEQVVDYKALVGDASDNIPGVRGIGPKTAQQLLEQFGTLDNIYANLDSVVPPRVRSALEAHRDAALLSRELAAIRCDVPIEVEWDACSADASRIPPAPVHQLFQELSFNIPARRFEELRRAYRHDEPAETIAPAQVQMQLFEAAQLSPIEAVQVSTNAPTQTQLVDSDEAFRELLRHLHSAQRIAFDTETSGTDPLRDVLLGIAFCTQPNQAWYLPFHGGEWSLQPLSPKLEPITYALQHSNAQLVAHNAKFDLRFLQRAGIFITRPIFDTMVAQFLCEPGERPLGLKSLAFTYLGWQMTTLEDLIGRGKQQINPRDVPLRTMADYSGADADATYHLVDVLTPMLHERQQTRLFHEVEMPLVYVLADMENTGVAVDADYLSQLSSEISARLRELEKRIYSLAGVVFNVNSPRQLGDVLFGRLGLTMHGARRTTSGALSTAADVLDDLRDQHPIVPLILEHRELAKLQGTYVDVLPTLINPETGRIHTEFNQTGAVTGRLTSSNPNLQNIPIKTQMGRRVRKAFVPRKGWKLISADYSQVELRILAHLADDPTLKAAFARNEDIHAATASVIYGVPLGEVTAMQRNNAKRINFGIAYGMGAHALAQNTGMSISEAQDFINRYFERFPRVKQWLDNTRQLAAEQGFVETVMGRRRYFPALRSNTKVSDVLRRRAEREAINHPVQGSAADIIKIAMINLHRRLQTEGFQAKMMLQVHDELVFDCPPQEVEVVKRIIVEEMENAFPLSVRLKSDVAVGPNWDEVA